MQAIEPDKAIDQTHSDACYRDFVLPVHVANIDFAAKFEMANYWMRIQSIVNKQSMVEAFSK